MPLPGLYLFMLPYYKPNWHVVYVFLADMTRFENHGMETSTIFCLRGPVKSCAAGADDSGEVFVEQTMRRARARKGTRR